MTADGEMEWPEADAASDGVATGVCPPSLSEAYSNMHKLDALLRDSDRRLKVLLPYASSCTEQKVNSVGSISPQTFRIVTIKNLKLLQHALSLDIQLWHKNW